MTGSHEARREYELSEKLSDAATIS